MELEGDGLEVRVGTTGNLDGGFGDMKMGGEELN